MRRELNWIVPCAALAAFQLSFAWLLSSTYEGASAPPVFGYAASLFPFVFFAVTLIASRRAVTLIRDGVENPSRELFRELKSERVLALVVGFVLLTLHISAFTWTKPILPIVGGFWADPLLANLDRSLFGADLLPLLASTLGSANSLVDLLYQAWFPVVIAAFTYVLACEPSPWRSRALTAFFLAWTIGMLFQFFLPAAGPLFYERLGFGDRFAGIDIPDFAQIGSEYLWKYHTGQDIGMAVGISAMPSMHVALATWLWLLFRKTRASHLALGFLLTIAVGSVSLGWHYAVDGIAGSIAACAAWAVSGVASARRLGLELPFGRVQGVRRPAQVVVASKPVPKARHVSAHPFKTLSVRRIPTDAR